MEIQDKSTRLWWRLRGDARGKVDLMTTPEPYPPLICDWTVVVDFVANNEIWESWRVLIHCGRFFFFLFCLLPCTVRSKIKRNKV